MIVLNQTIATKIENEYLEVFGDTGKTAHITDIYSLLFKNDKLGTMLAEPRSKKIIEILEDRGWGIEK